MSAEEVLNEVKDKMKQSLENLDKALSGLRVGRASTNLLDPIRVDYYGDRVPISQVAVITISDAKTLSIQPFEKSMGIVIQKAISDYKELGVSTAADGNIVRVILPDLNEARRKELAKLADKIAEESKVAIRNVRRDGNEQIKSLEKSKEITEDDLKKFVEKIQSATDDSIKEVDKKTEIRQKEIMTV